MIPVLLLGCFLGFGIWLRKHEPLADWLFPRYAGYASLALLYALACFSSGHLLVRRLLGGRVLPLLEHLSVSFAGGVYLFYLGMFLGGIGRLYGRAFFVALPLALIAAGAVPFFRYLRRAARHVAGARRRAPARSPWTLAVHGFGVLGLLLVYFAILSPNNVAFDSRWMHLGIAEHYAAEGAVRRFPEGWYVGAGPHLASYLYTWAFLLPKGTIADHVALAAQLEFVTFALGLLGIPALVRALLRHAGTGPDAYRWAWAARFLFPGLFLYDSSLCLGADHIASIFAAPIYLLLLRTWKDRAPRSAALLALVLTGGLLTKWTGALLLVAPALLAVAVRTVTTLIAALRRRIDFRAVWAAPLTATLTGLVFFSPHWLKNLIWYGDPLYPVLHRRFHPHPWTVDSAARFDIGFMALLWKPTWDKKGILNVLASPFSFSFVPNDWGNFHGATPILGSLFTLVMLLLPLLKGARRIWGLYGATLFGILVWYVTNHQDRYLQAAMPWMAAATAAVLALVWREGLAARIAASLLVGLQIVWGADVYFMPAHIYLGIPAKASLDLLSRTPGKPVGSRFAYADGFIAVGKQLPPKSKALIHEYHPHLGIGAPTVTDCPLHQGGISYARTPTPREVFDQLSGYGVTHLVYRTAQSREPDNLAGEIVFANFIQRFARGPKPADGWTVAAMPTVPPPPGNAPDPVLVITCGRNLKPGLYRLADLATVFGYSAKPVHDPRPTVPGSDIPTLLPRAQAVAQDTACASQAKGLEATFVKAGQRDPYALWVRK